MSGGELRHRITIEQPTETLSDSGEVTTTWTTYAELSAAIEPSGGRETWRAQQSNPELTHAVTIRWQPAVTTKMRIKFVDHKENRTRYFGIDSIRTKDERRDYLMLLCIEDVNG